MYAAKRAGGGMCVAYEPSMSGDVAEQILMQEALRQAIERHELVLHYQPKLDVKIGRVHGLEALLRWRHPARGMSARQCSSPWPNASDSSARSANG